jgi:hypothetical protein
MNQSLEAFLARLFVPSHWVVSPFDAPLVKRVLSVVFGLAIAARTLWALGRRRRPPALLAVEMAAILLATLALMKLTWVHTLCAMLWVWPVVMLVILRAAERGAPWARRAGILACIGFFLSSAHIPVLWERLRHGPALLLTGVHLFGVLILWDVCLRILRDETNPPDRTGV